MDKLARQIFDGVDESVRRTLTPVQRRELEATADWLAEHAKRTLTGEATELNHETARTLLHQLETMAGLATAQAVRATFKRIVENAARALLALV